MQRKETDIREKSTAAEKVQAAYVPVESDFRLKNNAEEIGIDSNFAAQSFWKDVLLRFVRKTSAIVGLILIILITIMAAIGPGMNGYTYSGQNLNEKNCAPRVKALEKFGIFDGNENFNTSKGTKTINNYEEKGLTDVYYWFGSDNLGRDIWTRTWSGARELWSDLRLFWRKSGYGHAAYPGGCQRYSETCYRNPDASGI